MSLPAHRRATYDDILGAPEHMVAEIVDGEMVTSPQPAFRHVRASSVLGVTIGGPFDLGANGPGGWWILVEPELHLGRDVLVPDLAGWRRERMPVFPDVPFSDLAPDWVCEVLSPATEQLDRVRKMPIYAREQVGHAWLINPVHRTLEVFRREGERWVPAAAHGGDEKVRAEPFEAVELALSVLWIGTEGG
ncbi:MAG: Uma2 family endonuclease [Myxococcota bacterium]|nr:Uma2 family endonuclease [Myxococcota bacterium]